MWRNDAGDVVWGTIDTLARPGVLLLLAAGTVLSLLLGPWLGGRIRRSHTALTGTFLSLTVILALTMPVDGRIEAPRMSAEAFWRDLLDPAAYAHYREWGLGSSEGLANIALFVPFAFCLALVTRRFVLTALAGIALSVAIETVQSMSYRAATVFDVVNNSLGVLIGVALALVVTLAAIPIHRARRALTGYCGTALSSTTVNSSCGLSAA